MDRIDRHAILGEEGGHGTVAGGWCVAIYGNSDDEKGPVCIRQFPSGPVLRRLVEFQNVVQRCQNTCLEGECAIQVADADGDVRQHL